MADKVSCRRRARLLPLLIASLIGLLGACSGDPGTGPVEVKWDRDVCKRCNMVLSDRRHSAQVRHSPAGRPSQVYKFDDLGCAVLWLKDQPWRDDPKVEIWVNDHANGKWLDAREAHYVRGQITPMEYGLGAQTEATADTLDFARAIAHIEDIEKRFNVHGSHLEQAAAARSLAPAKATQEKQE